MIKTIQTGRGRKTIQWAAGEACRPHRAGLKRADDAAAQILRRAAHSEALTAAEIVYGAALDAAGADYAAQDAARADYDAAIVRAGAILDGA